MLNVKIGGQEQDERGRGRLESWEGEDTNAVDTPKTAAPSSQNTATCIGSAAYFI